jgi:hypothetical protein
MEKARKLNILNFEESFQYFGDEVDQETKKIVQSLILNMLNEDPESRIDIGQVLASQWMQREEENKANRIREDNAWQIKEVKMANIQRMNHIEQLAAAFFKQKYIFADTIWSDNFFITK